MYFVKLLENISGVISINTRLKVVLGFRGVFDTGFLFIVEIWHYVQNRSGSTLSSISCQIFAVSPANSYIVDLCPNLWCNKPKENFFLGIWFRGFPSFLPSMYVFSVRCAAMSLRSDHCHWRKSFKTLCEKVRYVTN